MHTSHNIAHSNLSLTGYTLTDFLMLLYLIPSVTLQLHSLSISYVTASQSLMQSSLRSTTLVYFSYVSHATVSESLTQQPSLHPLMLYSLILCAHECYLTSHSFRAHVSSHDSVSPFLTQLSVPIPIPHAIFALSLTRSRYLALLIARAISIALSLSHRAWPNPAVYKATRPCL